MWINLKANSIFLRIKKYIKLFMLSIEFVNEVKKISSNKIPFFWTKHLKVIAEKSNLRADTKK